jgi:hypothetical protein
MTATCLINNIYTWLSPPRVAKKEEEEEEFFNHYKKDLKRHAHTLGGGGEHQRS